MLEQKYDRVPWTARQTFTGVFFTLVPWLAFTGLIGLTASTSHPVAMSPRLDLVNALATLIFSLVSEGIFLVAPLYFARRTASARLVERETLWQVLGFRNFSFGRTLPLLFIFIVAIFAVNEIYQFLITTLHLPLQTNAQVIIERAKFAPVTTYVSLVVAVCVAPFCEEIFFRSFTFMGLLGDMPAGIAIVLSSLIFAVAHGDPGSFIVLFCIGLALAFLRWRTRSIWPGIILHLLNNALGALSIILAMHGGAGF